MRGPLGVHIHLAGKPVCVYVTWLLIKKRGEQVIGGRRAGSYTHLRAHETKANLVCRLPLEKKNYNTKKSF